MKRHLRITLLAMLGLAGVALAAAYSGAFAAMYTLPVYLKGGLFVGNGAAANTVNRVTKMPGGVCAYDFPTIGGKSDSLLPICADSFPCTVPDALVGDPCFVASLAGADAGTGLDVAVSLTCNITAPGVGRVRACAHMSDAGTIDMADAGYYLRAVSGR